jgi:hypothetical protein
MPSTVHRPFPHLIKSGLHTRRPRQRRPEAPGCVRRAIQRFKSALLFNAVTTAAVLAATAAVGWSGRTAFAAIHQWFS